jgi:hypothetical protein
MLKSILHGNAQLFKPGCPVPIAALIFDLALDNMEKSAAS